MARPAWKRPKKNAFYKAWYIKRLSANEMCSRFKCSVNAIKRWRIFYGFSPRGWAHGHPRKGKKGSPAWNKGMMGKKHPLWRGGLWLHKKSGYLYKYIGHKTGTKFANYRAEHRYIMEKHLGRSLLKIEHIHHKNGIKTDNRIKNLSLHSPSSHTKLH